MPTPAVTPADPKRRNALGKGIESLLGPRPQGGVAIAAAAEPGGKPLEIALDQIDRNPHQTRTLFDEVKLKELAQSIAASGVVQPIVVREVAGGRYQLIMGERRWRASQIAGKATIPAIVRKVSDEQAMEMTIVENLQRADLNPMEQARAYDRLIRDFKMTQEQVAQRTGKDRASVSNFIRLLKLQKSTQDLIEAGELTYGHGRALLGLDSSKALTDVVQAILKDHLSVRQTEAMVAAILNPEAKPKKKAVQAWVPDANVREAQEQLQRRLGLKVQIEDKQGKGRVIIEYSGVDDFDAILSALGE
ncbi:MAG TPA: ParB/RepB/Spo0J family partition protein [Acidobacteriaceae bacterium]|nr:ParB/RepB/Spo0J family partition protein [Acidobacteriaceae bacterium]